MEKPHKKLDAWKLSMELAGDVYRLADSLPVDERPGIASQMKRAAVRIPSSLAEGAVTGSSNEFRRFVSVARGFLRELDTQLDLCLQLKFITPQSRREVDTLLLRVDKKLYALRQATKPVQL